jgi:hypothetical protein
MSRSYTSSPPKRLHGVQRDCFTLHNKINHLRSLHGILHYVVWFTRGRGSSVSIVCDYRLDDGVRSPAEAFISSLSVEAHPASCTMGTGGPYRRAKARPGRDGEHSPHLVPRSRTSRSYASSPPWRLHCGTGTALVWFIQNI